MKSQNPETAHPYSSKAVYQLCNSSLNVVSCGYGVLAELFFFLASEITLTTPIIKMPHEVFLVCLDFSRERQTWFCSFLYLPHFFFFCVAHNQMFFYSSLKRKPIYNNIAEEREEEKYKERRGRIPFRMVQRKLREEFICFRIHLNKFSTCLGFRL